jgi:predicted MFS family arabinose efflux permease
MASVICAISIIALSAVEGFGGLVIFAWVYGFSLGGYNYALKVYTYERVRARHFPRAWSFVQCSQAIPLVIGVPLTGSCDETKYSNVGS